MNRQIFLASAGNDCMDAHNATSHLVRCNNSITRGTRAFVPECFVCLCVLAVTVVGCCTPMIRSERFADCEMTGSAPCDNSCGECDLCHCRHVMDHFFLYAHKPHAL